MLLKAPVGLLTECGGSTTKSDAPIEDNPCLPEWRKTIAKRLFEAKPVSLPPEYFKFLKEVKDHSDETVKLYKHCLGYFLRFVKLAYPSMNASFEVVWDTRISSEFLQIINLSHASSTASNYHTALKSGRKCLSFYQRQPTNAYSLEDSFKTMASVAQRRKLRDLRSRKMQLHETTSTFADFYNKFYIGDIWDDIVALIKRVRTAVVSKTDIKLSKLELFKLNTCGLGLLAASNYLRPGNFRKIEYEAALKALEAAYEEFTKKFPHVRMEECESPIDRAKMVPVILVIEENAKHRQRDYAVLLNPRDIWILRNYARYVRPNGPREPCTNKLFINCRGKGLGLDLSRYMQFLGKMCEIPGLSFTRLRALAETENLRDKPEADMPNWFKLISGTSRRIGHSDQVCVLSHMHLICISYAS